MSESKRNIIKATLSQGLASANRSNPFWTQADAMQAFAIYHKNAK